MQKHANACGEDAGSCARAQQNSFTLAQGRAVSHSQALRACLNETQ